MRRFLSVLVIAGLLTPMLPVAPAHAVFVLGQIATNGAKLDGIAVPSGTTILDPSTIATGDSPAVIHLGNGMVIAMAPHSSASFSGAGSGSVAMAVDSGEVAMRDVSGSPTIVKAGSSTVLAVQQGGGVQQGETKDEDDEAAAAAAGGGGGWPWWAFVAIGGGVAWGTYEITKSDSTAASPSTTG